MLKIGANDSSLAVRDIQQRLAKIELLEEREITGVFDGKTEAAIEAFCEIEDIEKRNFVDDEVWKSLVRATYDLGDRTLYLRMPHFKGADCKKLQHILGVLGFSSGVEDGEFGGVTEAALRVFQLNMGLPSDGIAGALTFQAINNLHHSWESKQAYQGKRDLSFARVAQVLENNTVCLFGTCEFSRSVAKRMSNLSLATTPQSKVVSADALSVAPDTSMLLFEILLDETQSTPSDDTTVDYDESEKFSEVMTTAIKRAYRKKTEKKIRVKIKDKVWETAGPERSAQHYAINLLDSLCVALNNL